jgi:hypothetical protein
MGDKRRYPNNAEAEAKVHSSSKIFAEKKVRRQRRPAYRASPTALWTGCLGQKKREPSALRKRER